MIATSGLDERASLKPFLDRQRELVHRKLAGLSDDDARAVATPSGLTDLLAAYRAECARCDAAIADLPLDALSTRRDRTVRWVYLHLVEETARHLGHLDLLCELADGRTGEDPGDA